MNRNENKETRHPTPARLDPASRREWLTVLALGTGALLLRFHGFTKLGLTHFDEGVYALAGTWAVSPGGLGVMDPQVIAYAPPGLPVLIGVAYSILGVADSSAMLVPLLAGVATVPVLAWLGRRTFGTGAGAIAATFGSCSMAHLAFSRKALTDVPFLLAWLAAVGLGGRFLERPRLGRAIALGLAVGIAQNFKYNGGMAGLIVVAAALLGVVTDRENRSRKALLSVFGLGAIAALIAAAVYWPWYSFVEAHGGYAALTRHHRSYLGGPGSWWPHLRQQLAQIVALSGGAAWACVTSMAVAVVVLLVGPAVTEHAGTPRQARRGLVIVSGLTALLALAPDLGWWAGIGFLPWLVRDPRPARRVLASWWIVLSAITPFYHPYARLWLPLHAAGWLLLAGGVSGQFLVAEAPRGQTQELSRLRPSRVGLAWLGAVLAASIGFWGTSRPVALPLGRFWASTTVLRGVADDLAERTPRNPSQALRLYVRRPLVFYLATRTRVPFSLLPDATALILGSDGSTGEAILDEAQLGEPIGEAITRRWEVLQSWPDLHDPVTELDVHPAAVYEISTNAKAADAIHLLRRLSTKPSQTTEGHAP